ncbi:MAG: hypothetical protein ACRDJK_02500 [Actinomycetota bacterium]
MPNSRGGEPTSALWPEMSFPESGQHVIPRGPAVLRIDREAGLGTYFEPNAWIRHAVEKSKSV